MAQKRKNQNFVNPAMEVLTQRMQKIYETEGDTRDPFFRDYNRILHSNAYRRLKHKTQVFFNIKNDHICTRMEHVGHVEAVSHSIALGLGLNIELTSAIACGHDLGHAPFGHHGESVLNRILDEYLTQDYKEQYFGVGNNRLFWHEKNGLRFVDSIELLPDPYGIYKNLNLTYAVRDGIISHCGEIDENAIKPRTECFNLSQFQHPGQYAPCTWEGCVVKIADKIAYLGRDIEDAIILNMIAPTEMNELKKIAINYCGRETLNTTGIMHSLIGDICNNSSPEEGICLGKEKLELLNQIKNYNYNVIYGSPLFDTYKKYVELVLESIFSKLYAAYHSDYTIQSLMTMYAQPYPELVRSFTDWLGKYCVERMLKSYDNKFAEKFGTLDNEKIYGDLKDKNVYVQAIVDYISGMTDAYAISTFNELISFS